MGGRPEPTIYKDLTALRARVLQLRATGRLYPASFRSVISLDNSNASAAAATSHDLFPSWGMLRAVGVLEQNPYATIA